MKGKGLTTVKNDVKQWVVKRTKSGGATLHAEVNANPTESEHDKTKSQTNARVPDVETVMERMDISTAQGTPTMPAKVQFVAKGIQFRIDPRYSFIKTLGAGAYGVVCSAKDTQTGKQVAVKKVAGVFDDQTDAKRIIREIRLLSSMRHENILSITDIDEPEFYSTYNDVYLVTELMDTDLNKLLRSKHALLDAQRKFFAYQLFRALKYIHSASILHRDLKPANVLVSENCDLKICDFGLARYVDPEDATGQAMTEYVVTRWYRAPELLLAGDDYSTAIDMWSAGCLIAELYTRKPIFPGKDVKNQIEIISRVLGKPGKHQLRGISNPRARDFLSKLPDSAGVHLADLMKGACPLAVDLVRKLLQFDPKDRLSASDALNHDYVAEFRDEASELSAAPTLSMDSLEPPSEKKLGRDGIRRLMWDEVLRFHPEARYREPPAALAAQKKVQAVLQASKS